MAPQPRAPLLIVLRLAVWLCALVWAGLAVAAPADRVALVIGNSAYAGEAALGNPANDARDMARKLEDLGFEVVAGFDLDLASLRDSVRDFAGLSRSADIAVIYYAGHGIADTAGKNFLVPINAKLTHEDDIPFETYPVEDMIAYAKRANNASLIFLDACRNFPDLSHGNRSAPRYRNIGRIPTGPSQSTTGTVIAYATEPGSVAEDGDGSNSPFTQALLAHLGTEGMDFAAVTSLITRDVMEATGNAQRPRFDLSLNGPLVLNPARSPNLSGLDDQRFLFELANRSQDVADFKTYLRYFPEGVYAEYARNAIARLETKAPDTAALRPADAPPPRAGSLTLARLPLALPVTDTLRNRIASTTTEHLLALTHRKRVEIQMRLFLMGIDTGGIDGVFGRNTRSGLQIWQKMMGLPETGFLNMAQLQLLTATTEPALQTHLTANPKALDRPRPVATKPTATPEPQDTAPKLNPIDLLGAGLDYLGDKVLGLE